MHDRWRYPIVTMSRNKRNWDHLVDEAGNYKASGSPNETHQAFCSFDGDNASNFFGGFNIDRVERVSRGEYNIYFKVFCLKVLLALRYDHFGVQASSSKLLYLWVSPNTKLLQCSI